MTQLIAVSEVPTQYHIDIFRHLHTALGSQFAAIYGGEGQAAGARYASWGDSVIVNKTGLLEGYPYKLARERGPLALSRALRNAGVGPGTVVVFHTIYPRFSRGAALASRALGARLLFRGSTNLSPYGGWKNRLRTFRDRLTFRLFDGFCATGTATWQHFSSLAPGKPLTFAPYCADEYVIDPIRARYDAHRSSERSTLGVSDDETLVAFLGRFISIKNVERLVEAFTRIEGKMIRLVLAGDGPLRDRVLDLIDSKNWKTKPLYVGYLDREGIGRMLCASDALAVPSLHEPWGVVVNEALHLNNVCLVTSGVCAGRDLIIEGTNGTFVDPLSIESIADGLVRVHEIVKDGNYAPANLFLSNLFSAKNAAAGILAGAHLGEPYLRRPPGLDRLNPQAHSWVAHLP